MDNFFEIHQGEWTYITKKDNVQFLSTANVVQCTVFCGIASNGFSFMFHFDTPTRKRLDTLNEFKNVLSLEVPDGEEIKYHLAGGWKCLWATKVRCELDRFMSNLEGYKVEGTPHKYTDEVERFSENFWKKGFSFNLSSGEIGVFPKEVQTKRRRSVRAWLPFCQMPLVRPGKNA